MQDLRQVRFITTNYSALQGLRMIPFNLLAVLVAWWINGLEGPNRELTWPLLLFLLCILMYVGIDLYYKRVFGQVQQSARDRNVDFLIAITFGVLAMIAYAIDTGLVLPFSSLGLVFALGLGVEWARLTRRAPGPYVRYYLLLALLIAAISLLPALTPGAWWEAVGFHQPVVAILAVVGLFGMLAGLISHFYLLRALRANREAVNGPAL